MHKKLTKMNVIKKKYACDTTPNNDIQQVLMIKIDIFFNFVEER